MDPKRQREIASEGGRAAHASGHAHEWDSKEAREAGRKGGLAVHQRNASAHESGARSARRQNSADGDRGHDAEGEHESDRHAKRGFAAMSPDRQREIASKGGRASRGGRGREPNEQGADEARPGDERRQAHDGDQTHEHAPHGHEPHGHELHGHEPRDYAPHGHEPHAAARRSHEASETNHASHVRDHEPHRITREDVLERERGGSESERTDE